MTTPITIAYGDGIGPEIIEATLRILREAGAELAIETIEIGKRVYNMGGNSGILPSSFDTLLHSRILLKGPTLAPEGEQENVTTAICKKFGMDVSEQKIETCDFMAGISAVAYISEYFSIFEPQQAAAPEIKGKNKANPSAAILASAMMLEHIGQHEAAARIRTGWRKTAKDGIHTRDIYARGASRKKAGTQQFADAVIDRLYSTPYKAIA